MIQVNNERDDGSRVIFVDAKVESKVESKVGTKLCDNRGLHFGDGFFTTLACIQGELQYLDWHLDRIQSSFIRLDFPKIDRLRLQTDLKLRLRQLISSNDSHAIRLSFWREQVQRGYRASQLAEVRALITRSPLAPINEHFKVDFSSVPASINPRLAGIKHLNRLDNVLAASSAATDIDEVLMLADGYVIGGCRSNLFLLIEGVWHTPLLDRAGVEGITRQRISRYMHQHEIKLNSINLNRTDVLGATSAFVCNSLIGIRPIRQLAQIEFDMRPVERLKFGFQSSCT